jgi:protein SCO1/2
LNFKSKLLLIFFGIVSITYSCYEHLPLKQDIKRTQNEFLDQDSVLVKFPEIIKDKVTLFAMIYTHCPDICPMTTHNMKLIEDSLNSKFKGSINLVVITFDPKRDSPSVLKEYAKIRAYDFSRWIFLSGDETNTKEVMLKFGIKAVKTDSSFDEKGNLNYYINHTDRLTLIDNKGFIRKYYHGSVINVEEVLKDIEYLLTKN